MLPLLGFCLLPPREPRCLCHLTALLLPHTSVFLLPVPLLPVLPGPGRSDPLGSSTVEVGPCPLPEAPTPKLFIFFPLGPWGQHNHAVKVMPSALGLDRSCPCSQSPVVLRGRAEDVWAESRRSAATAQPPPCAAAALPTPFTYPLGFLPRQCNHCPPTKAWEPLPRMPPAC